MLDFLLSFVLGSGDGKHSNFPVSTVVAALRGPWDFV